MPKSPDDLEGLKAERDAADRAYNEALTRLDAAIQQLPADFPHPPPGPDERQITPLNTLWKLDLPAADGGVKGRFVAAVRRALAPVVEQQQAFNSAIVDHLNRNLAAERQARESAASTLAVLRAHIEQSIAFQSLLVMFLQQITPYVDTRDRDVAGLLRGLSGAINGVADEMMRRTDALVARERRHDTRAVELDTAFADLRSRLAELESRLAALERQ